MLQGKKVKLRAIEQEDLERLHQFNNDLAVEVAGGGDPPMPQSLARLQAEFESNWQRGGREGMSFAIEVEGNFIGICGLFNHNPEARACELGITIGDKDYWGRGIGREALQLLLHYAFHYRNLRRIYLNVNGTNERAIRAYRACGFVEEGRLRRHVWSDGTYIDLVYMGILRDEWKEHPIT
jgi:RimJ/RimL family protein N-acetyltransferase